MQGMGKTLENHGNPCTGHLVPEPSYMAVIYNLTLWLVNYLL